MTDFTLSDGRKVKVCDSSSAIADQVCAQVAAAGKAAIAAKGAFSLGIPGGSIVEALSKLPKDSFDMSKMHIFFCNERIGEFKCFKNATKNLVEPLGVPAAQVYKVGEGAPEAVAEAYTAMLRGQPDSVCGKTASGMPVLDMILLGTGADGHVGSLHPNKSEIKQTGEGKPILSINEGGKTSVCVSMDFIRAAKKVVLTAAKGERSEMVARASAATMEPTTFRRRWSMLPTHSGSVTQTASRDTKTGTLWTRTSPDAAASGISLV